MKTKVKRLSKRSLAMLLGIILLVSSLGLGTLLTANAYAGYDKVFAYGSWAGQSGYSNYSNSWNWYELTNLSDGYFYSTFIFQCNKTSSSSSTYDYDFLIKVQKSGSGGWTNDANGNYWFTSSATGPTDIYGNGSNFKLRIAANATGYASVRFSCNPADGTQKLSVFQESIKALSASYSTTSNSISTGESLNVYPSISGGTGNYNVTYTVTKDGSSVTASDYISSNNFSTSTAGTYTVKATVKDSTLSGLSSASTSTRTITVNPKANYYVWGGKTQELNNTSYNTSLALNSTTGRYEGYYTLSDTSWHSILLSKANNSSSFDREWNSYGAVAWSLDTYNSGTVYKNYSSTHREPSSGNMSGGFLNYVEVTNYGSSWGLKLGAKTAGTTIKLSYDPSTQVLYISEGSSTNVNVTVKDGAMPGGTENKYKTFASIARTRLYTSSSYSTTKDTAETTYSGISAYYGTATATKGDTLYIKTIIDSSYRSKFYVKAFNVNGKSVKVFNKSDYNTSGAYQYAYKIPADYEGNNLEITPVYYHYNDSNCVTFYLEGYDETIQNTAGWGDSPYVYPFYGSLDNIQNSFGAYSGQPMVCDGGKYYIQIPITSLSPLDTTNDGTAIRGVVLSNGYSDLVHRTFGLSSEKQSYDYDDFYKIKTEKNPSNIYFRLKYKTKRDNANTYRSGDTTTLSSTTISGISSSGNGWEQLLDRRNRIVDIFGDQVTGANLNYSPVYAISVGYVANMAGDYGTEWRIYKPNATTGATSWSLERVNTTPSQGSRGKQDSIPPSLLNLNSVDSFNTTTYPDTPSHTFTVNGTDITHSHSINEYKALYTKLKADCAGYPVMISYEWEDQPAKKNYTEYINGGSSDNTVDTGNNKRIDGRWTYTKDSDVISSNIKIEYSDNQGASYTEDTFTTGESGENNQGTHCGGQAYFTNTEFMYLTSSGNVTLDKTKTFDMKAVTGSDYKFVGWYVKHDSSYTPMNNDNVSALTASTMRDSSDTYVARFMKLAAGSLKITDNVVKGTFNGTNYQGSGSATMTVEFTTNNSTWTTIATQTADDVTLGATYINETNRNNANCKIRVTLYNTPNGDDTFGTYGHNGTAYNSSNNVFTFTVESLFTANGSNGYTQTTLKQEYQTYFNQVLFDYEVTYTYTSYRLGKTQTYTHSGTFADSERVAAAVSGSGNDRRLTDAYITSNAPKETNFNKNTTLTINSKAFNTSASPRKKFTATATFTDTADTTKKVTFDLPYAYNSSHDANSWYNQSNNIANMADSETFDLNATYNQFITKTGTASDTYSESAAMTAPLGIRDTTNNVTKYFHYWLIKNTKGKEVAKVYSLSFNYRIVDKYTIEAVYDATSATQYISDADNGTATASISYLGTTRNQWNNGGNGGYTVGDSKDAASDILFNDFMLAYDYKDKVIRTDVASAECGVFVEKVGTLSTDSNGDYITDMDYYESNLATSAATKLNSIKTALATSVASAKTAVGSSALQYDLKNSLNNKNRLEFFYQTYNSYYNGSGTTERTVKNNLYRAYAYIRVSSTEYYVSPGAYFSMYETATSKYE